MLNAHTYPIRYYLFCFLSFQYLSNYLVAKKGALGNHVYSPSPSCAYISHSFRKLVVFSCQFLVWNFIIFSLSLLWFSCVWYLLVLCCSLLDLFDMISEHLCMILGLKDTVCKIPLLDVSRLQIAVNWIITSYPSQVHNPCYSVGQTTAVHLWSA